MNRFADVIQMELQQFIGGPTGMSREKTAFQPLNRQAHLYLGRGAAGMLVYSKTHGTA